MTRLDLKIAMARRWAKKVAKKNGEYAAGLRL